MLTTTAHRLRIRLSDHVGSPDHARVPVSAPPAAGFRKYHLETVLWTICKGLPRACGARSVSQDGAEDATGFD